MSSKFTPEQIESFIIKKIEKKGKLPEGVDPKVFNYIDSGYIDSIAVMQFVVQLEDEFDVEISEDDMLEPSFRTIGGLAQLIVNKG